MRLLAIDFGTSNTVAVVRNADGRSRPLLFDGTPLLPSAVCLDPAGALLVGRDAERAARLDPARFEPHPKRRIDDGAVLLGGREVPVTYLVAAVLRRVAVEAERQLGGVDEVRLTHPARWGERRRSVLVAAALAAGLPPPRLVVEPVAAAAYYPTVLGAAMQPGRALAVYDLGGGTFDAAVVRRTVGGFEVLAELGLTDLGGLDFDQALVEHLGRGYAGTRPELWHGLVSPADTERRRQRALLYDDVRGAKELLSRMSSAEVHLPALDIRAHLTREELESLIRRQLLQTVNCLARTIAAAELDPADLVGIFLVGGSSRIPLAARLIHAELGIVPSTLDQPETVVAEGALCHGTPQSPGHPADPAPRHPGPGGSTAEPGDLVAARRGGPMELGGPVLPSGPGPGAVWSGAGPAGPPTGQPAPGPGRTGAAPTTRAGGFWYGTTGLVWTGSLAVLVAVALVVLVVVAGAG
ncbi:Hsp70 family protein [Plantactinospora solaniradicis]|uniref:Hsp70 family protein n=1 Tax=Plantactinospora solaniradicis TaxID=1723736 RepID=A0ABW1KJM4_9ACTN